MEIEVFECNSGISKKGNPYNIALVRIDGKVGKLFSDVALPSGKVKVEVEMSANREMFLTPKISKLIA